MKLNLLLIIVLITASMPVSMCMEKSKPINKSGKKDNLHDTIRPPIIPIKKRVVSAKEYEEAKQGKSDRELIKEFSNFLKEFQKGTTGTSDENAYDCDEFNNALKELNSCQDIKRAVNIPFYGGETILFFALGKWKGDESFAKRLCVLGADVNAKRIPGFIFSGSPLYMAIDQGNLELVKMLCSFGADIHSFCNTYQPPFHKAVRECNSDFKKDRRGNYDIVDYLYSIGADIHAWDAQGRTCVHNLLETSTYSKKDFKKGLLQTLELVCHLCFLGFDINTPNKDGKTVLHTAGQLGSKKIVKCLIGLGAQVNAIDNDHMTPLDWAEKNAKSYIKKHGGMRSHKLKRLNGGVERSSEFSDGHKQRLALFKQQEKEEEERNRANVQAQIADRSSSYQSGSFSQSSEGSVQESISSDISSSSEEQKTFPIQQPLPSKNAPKQTPSRAAAPIPVQTTTVRQTDAWHGVSDEERKAAFDRAKKEIDKVDPTRLNYLVIEAVKSDDAPKLEALLQLGANPNTRDDEGLALLHHAAMQNNLEMITSLKKGGADLEIKHGMGNTPLFLAAMNNRVEALRLLRSFGARLDLRIAETGSTPLLEAIYHGFIEIIKCLVELGADVNARGLKNSTPLHWAVERDAIPVIVCLKSLGANLELKDDDGDTPLFRAALNNKLEAVECLHSLGAKVNTQSIYGFTPLMEAAIHGYIDMVRLLANAGADHYAKNNEGHTILHVLSLRDNILAMSCIKALGVNLESKDSEKKATPLHFAANAGSLAAVKKLHQLGAKINARNGNEQTPLMLAAGNGHVEVMRYLVLSAGADLSAVNDQNNTALNHAIFFDQVAAIMCLKELGHNFSSSEVEKALHYARESNKQKAIDCLMALKQEDIFRGRSAQERERAFKRAQEFIQAAYVIQQNKGRELQNCYNGWRGLHQSQDYKNLIAEVRQRYDREMRILVDEGLEEDSLLNHYFQEIKNNKEQYEAVIKGQRMNFIQADRMIEQQRLDDNRFVNQQARKFLQDPFGSSSYGAPAISPTYSMPSHDLNYSSSSSAPAASSFGSQAMQNAGQGSDFGANGGTYNQSRDANFNGDQGNNRNHSQDYSGAGVHQNLPANFSGADNEPYSSREAARGGFEAYSGRRLVGEYLVEISEDPVPVEQPIWQAPPMHEYVQHPLGDGPWHSGPAY